MGIIAVSNENNGGTTVLSERLPVNPFRSLYAHFGMLLGVDDFQALSAYHRGKAWFHNAWLHREGVIWGLEVELGESATLNDDGTPQLTGEIRVNSGAALDALGRELYLQQAACLDIAAWYQANEDSPALAEVREIEDTGAVHFSAHVVIEFRSCLTRQVPAIAEPCEGGASVTAYSRVAETVELRLLPGTAETADYSDRDALYTRVRLLFGLRQPRTDDSGEVVPADQAVLDARADIANGPGSERAIRQLNYLRDFAALDEMDLAPEQQVNAQHNAFPRLEPAPVLLANLHNLVLVPDNGSWLLQQAEVDNLVRPVLLPTAVIQDLLTGAIPAVSPQATGPVIDRASVSLSDTQLQFRLQFSDAEDSLLQASLDARSVILSVFDSDGWADVTFDSDSLTYEPTTSTVGVTLPAAPAGQLLRLIVKGSGPYPVLNDRFAPLAGSLDSPVGSAHDGSDFVHIITLGS